VRQREPRRYEITHVPATIRSRDRLIGCGEPVLSRYERVVFEKGPYRSLRASRRQLLSVPAIPCLMLLIDLDPGALPATSSAAAPCWWMLAGSRARSPGCSFIWNTPSRTPGYYSAAASGVSFRKRILYVEMDAAGNTRHLHYAPYLDYRPLSARRAGCRDGNFEPPRLCLD
jgi:hypothetical protein